MSESNYRPWGRDDLMAIAAVRYCLGRMTYITGNCADWLVEQWPYIKPSAQNVIKRDVEEAFERDDKARAEGDGLALRALGMDCDRTEWKRVRKLWSAS